MVDERATAARKAKDLQMVLSAARMVAWEIELATGKVEYSSGVDAEQIRFCLDDQALVSELVDHALQRTGPYSVESRVVKPDGGVIWIRNQGEVIRDAEGRPSRVIGIALDITEHKETDDLLRNIAAGVSAATGEAFFRLLAQHLCLALKTDFACIGELHGKNQDTVQTIAMFAGAQFSEGLEYELAGTPCREAVMSGHCSYPRSVQSSFPMDRLLVDTGIESYFGVALTGSTGEPVGVMSVMSRAPLKNVNSGRDHSEYFRSLALPRSWNAGGGNARCAKVRSGIGRSSVPCRTRYSFWIAAVSSRTVMRRMLAKLSLPPESVAGKKLEAVLTPEAAGLILQSSRTLEPDGACRRGVLSADFGPTTLLMKRGRSASATTSFLIIVRDVTDRKRAEQT